MIWTIAQTSWRRLRNNRSELILTFVVPIIFFSIFAAIFGSRDSSSSTPKIKTVISDEIDDPFTQRAIQEILAQNSLRLMQKHEENEPMEKLTRSQAEGLVRRGMASAAISFSPGDGDLPKIQVLTDSFDQVASQVLIALVQKGVFTARSQPHQPEALARDNSRTDAQARGHVPSPPNQPPPMPVIESIDLMGGEKTNPVITMYAAGIAVMFVLFSATTSSGSLLDEKENSTLDRLLCSRLTMDQLLLGKWLYLMIIGSLQLVLMFVWGALVFKIDLLGHLDGFLAMTVVTSGAAASFALLLATLCSSRTQLGWVSTIVILSMSALGGSMVPRYLMSETMQRFGLFTFNAWALDGFNKIFWREEPLERIGLELGVLAGCAALFIIAARILAVRWERT